MAQAKIRFQDWYAEMGKPVPLGLVPELLQVSRKEVGQAVQGGKLRVFTFRADNGKVFRMVPRVDLRRYGRNPLTKQRLNYAFRQMIAA